jgi:predicted transcriptional regulator
MADAGGHGSLQAVGLGETEAELYHALLKRGRLTLADLTRVGGHSPGVTRRAVDALVSRALVTRSAHKSPLLQAARPDWAVEGLILRKQRELEELRGWANEAAVQHRDSLVQDSASDIIEIIEGRDAIHQKDMTLQSQAKSEVLILDRPPYRSTGPVLNPQELERLAAGVAYRCIYHQPELLDPERLEWINTFVSAGEQARSLPEVPIKMVVVDRSLALLPLQKAPETLSAVICIHESSLLSALIEMFELLWDRSVPLGPRLDNAKDYAEERALSQLLAAGMKDAAIARHLGVTTRTVSRRLEKLLELFGASTRFQAGLQAAKRGWI